MPIHTVVVPIDGSLLSQQIIAEVCKLLDPHSARVVLVRVAEPVEGVFGSPPRPVSTAWPTPLYDSRSSAKWAGHPIFDLQVEASERAALAAELSETRAALEQAGFSVQVEVRFGEPADEIIACARDNDADFIAMATHGRTGLVHLVVGSVTALVIRRSPVPVLVMHPKPVAASAN